MIRISKCKLLSFCLMPELKSETSTLKTGKISEFSTLYERQMLKAQKDKTK